MIGKHKNRAVSFTLAHAGVLAAGLVLAPMLTAEIEATKSDTELSSLQSGQSETHPVIMRASLRAWWNCDTKDAGDVDV